MPEKTAAVYVSFYWGFAMIGRFIGSAILQKVHASKPLGLVAVAACLLVLLSMLTFGHFAMWAIILVGLFNSVMFPSIFTLGIAGLGPLTGKGSGLLIAAIVGGAILPVVEGALADRIGIHHAFICRCSATYTSPTMASEARNRLQQLELVRKDGPHASSFN